MSHPALRVMDDRCELGLKTMPQSPCALAVSALHRERSGQLLKDRQTGKDIPPCEWFVADKSANFCFFKYMQDNEGQGHDTIEIAALLHTTQASVYSSLARAVEAVKEAGLGEVLLGEEG